MKSRLLIAKAEPELCSRFFVACGYDVTTAATGVDCVAQLRSSRFGALLLYDNLSWGGADGVLALVDKDEDLPVIPIVLISGDRRPGLVRYPSVVAFHRSADSLSAMANSLSRVVAFTPRPLPLQAQPAALPSSTS